MTVLRKANLKLSFQMPLENLREHRLTSREHILCFYFLVVFNFMTLANAECVPEMLECFCPECKYFRKGIISDCDPATNMRSVTFQLKKGENCPPTQVYHQSCTTDDGVNNGMGSQSAGEILFS